MKSKGVTLIELIVVIGLLAVVGLIATSIFFTAVKSDIKSKKIQLLKQKGEFGLKVMEGIIRGGVRIDCGSAPSQVTVTDRRGEETTFICDSDEETIASQSASPAILIQGVENIDCSSFVSCDTSGTIPDVTIDFTLREGGEAGPGSQKTELRFKTSISPRNY